MQASQPVRTVIRFFVLLIAVYTVLMLPIASVERGYARCFRAVAGAVTAGVIPRDAPGTVFFRPNPTFGEKQDTGLVARNRRTQAEVGMGISTRYEGYLPVAFFLALLLATPVPWRRRAWAFVWGMLLLHLFIAAKLSLMAIFLFSMDHPAGLFSPGDLWRYVLQGVMRIIAPSPFTWLIVPTVIWILVIFRRQDLARLAGDSDS